MSKQQAFTRTTLELRGDFYLTDDFWVGVGPVMHRNIEATFGGFIPDMSLQDANGTVFKIVWKCFALTHTEMEYVDEFGFVYDANASGLEFIAKF